MGKTIALGVTKTKNIYKESNQYHVHEIIFDLHTHQFSINGVQYVLRDISRGLHNKNVQNKLHRTYQLLFSFPEIHNILFTTIACMKTGKTLSIARFINCYLATTTH